MDNFNNDNGWIQKDSGLTNNLEVVKKLIENSGN